jgi:oligopeptide/dipeptide ABC transporter ATP-binding protein
MIFISHDLNIVQFVSDDIMVLYKGRILEMGRKEEVFLRPLHPYTRMLMKAAQGEFCASKEEMNDIIIDEACMYYERCELADTFCATQKPNLIGTKEHSVACFKEANHIV